MLPGHINVVPGVKSIASCILNRHSTNELTFSSSRLLDLTNKIGIPLLSLELSQSLVISRKTLCASAGFISLHPQVLKPHASIHLHGFPRVLVVSSGDPELSGRSTFPSHLQTPK